jgi:hypothetical protein
VLGGVEKALGEGEMAWFAALLTASGAGDGGASLAALGGSDVASLGTGGIDELTRDWPTSGQSPGCSTAAVAAARNGGGGGGERKDEMVTTCDAGDVSNTVAQFGITRAPIINQR